MYKLIDSKGKKAVPTFSAEVLEQFAASIFKAVGAPEADATRVAKLQRAANVRGVEQVFDGNAVGSAVFEERTEMFVNTQQLFGKRCD